MIYPTLWGTLGYMATAKALTPDDVAPHADFFWQRVDKQAGCWLWRGRTTARGYGEIVRRGFTAYAHRVSWVLTHGEPLSEGLTIDHRCRVHGCVNPDHLDAVPFAENVARTRGIYARTPKAHVAKDGAVTWRVRFKDYSRGPRVIESSRTFPTEEAAREWVRAHEYQPLVKVA